MDLIGCINFAKDFVVSGTAGPNLYGMCESLWEPNLEPEDLFETISQALLNAQDRDALSGWGAVVHVMYVIFYFSYVMDINDLLFLYIYIVHQLKLLHVLLNLVR